MACARGPRYKHCLLGELSQATIMACLCTFIAIIVVHYNSVAKRANICIAMTWLFVSTVTILEPLFRVCACIHSCTPDAQAYVPLLTILWFSHHGIGVITLLLDFVVVRVFFTLPLRMLFRFDSLQVSFSYQHIMSLFIYLHSFFIYSFHTPPTHSTHRCRPSLCVQSYMRDHVNAC